MLINVTEIAAKKIIANLTKRGKGIGIRLGVRTTGCSGLAYVLEYIDAVNPEDIAFEQDGFVVVVDPKSVVYLEGVEVDYVRQGLNEGFEFTNPQEKDRCGCGESFRV
jgi:iron-sulfur cluster assembly protein